MKIGFSVIVTYILAVSVFSLSLILASAVSAQETSLIGSDGKPVVIGAKKKPRKSGLCLDYGKTRLGNGRPYRVVEPTRTITSHEGIDFCKRAGSPVISPADGRIRYIEWDNKTYGGVVGITTEFSVKPREGMSKSRVFVEMVHIVPLKNLKRGQLVRAGQIVGHVQEANRPSIGKTPHVHFAVRRCDDWPTCHLDPNFFWRDGARKVSCFDKNKAIPKGRMVAPIPC
ncbi:M23 family metallopeptidase [Ruegeria lacuscaerulensis]|uniref:M23 family metallopeptidase n=1 Tax=Ruegeria lacuscaerulensis TaxID=55218 RepID=UPI00147F5BF7|nr:M23 family metallopeptidase [Ruegeria lacuscaerulensis]